MALSTLTIAHIACTAAKNKKLRNTVIVLALAVLLIVLLPILLAGAFLGAVLSLLNSFNEEENIHQQAINEVKAAYAVEGSLNLYTLKAVDLFYHHDYTKSKSKLAAFVTDYFLTTYEETISYDTDGDGQADASETVIKNRFKRPDEIWGMLNTAPFSFDEAALTAIRQMVLAPPGGGLDDLYEGLDPGTEYVGGEFGWPVPGYYSISSYYGMRFGGSDFHTGIDFPAPMGASIKASNDGVVIRATTIYTPGVGYGKHVIVDHGGGYSTIYAHMSSVSVQVGDSVKRGDSELGKVGSTGWSTGPHLHFEVRVGGKHQNPLGYLK